MIYTVDQLEQSFTMEKWLSWALKDRPTKTKFERDVFGILISLTIDML